jgi:EAL domain-containing protein (putative c-di-GMP-specific phosphodiesterase class I)
MTTVARLLAGHGCPLAQGFHLGRPMPAADMTALLAKAAYTLP